MGFIVSVTEKVDQGTLLRKIEYRDAWSASRWRLGEEPEVEDVATVVMPRPLNPDTEESNGD